MTTEPHAGGRQHIDYFDPLRVTAAFGVIFMHTASDLLRLDVTPQWELTNVCTSLAFTSVPLFLMMSGYLILSSPRTLDIRCHLTRRLPHLLAPLAFWTVIAVVEVQLSQHTLSPATVLEGLVYSFRNPVMLHFWYMYQLVALYLLSPILCAALRSLDWSGHRYVLVLICAVTVHAMLTTALPVTWSRFVDFDVFDRLKLFSGNLWSFILGFYLGGARRRLPNWALALTGAGLLAAISLGSRALAQGTGYEESFVNQNVGFEVALAACVFLLWKQNYRAKKGITRFLRPLAALTFPIYMMHGLLLTLILYGGYGPHSFRGAAAISVLVFLACFLCVKTAASIRPLCYPATGMRYEDACRTCNWQYTFHALRNRPSAHGSDQKEI